MKSCCKSAVDEARRRWRSCGDTASQETAAQIAELQFRCRHMDNAATLAKELAGDLRQRMDAARSALLKIWTDGDACQHQHAREAFEALR